MDFVGSERTQVIIHLFALHFMPHEKFKKEQFSNDLSLAVSTTVENVTALEQDVNL